MSIPEDLRKNACARMMYLAHEAWLWGLFSAQNGNISQKLSKPYEAYLVITAQGSCKGHLEQEDFCILNWKNGKLLEGTRLSSETKVHLGIYDACECQAVVHCHPPKLLAWEIVSQGRSFMDLPIFETKMWNDSIGYVGVYQPGSQELADAVEQCAAKLVNKNPRYAFNGAIWMAEHGLCTWGKSLKEAFAIAEEMEHLADIALLTTHGDFHTNQLG